MTPGVDYAWSHPPASVLVAGGYRFVARYLSRDPSKNLTRPEADQLHAAGVATVSNWEAAPGAPLNGAAQGSADARDAAAQHLACGGPPDRPIYFSCDTNPNVFTAAQWAAVEDYYRAVNSVIGVQRTGAYGGYALVKRLLDKGLISWAWQTFAWSAGQWDGRAQLRQVQNGVQIGGADCDIDQATVVDYGQWGVTMAGSGITLSWGETLDAYLSRIEKIWVPAANAAAGLVAAAAADATRDAAMLAAIQAITAGGTSVDTQAVVSAINTVAAQESAAVTALQQQVAHLEQQLAAAGHALEA